MHALGEGGSNEAAVTQQDLASNASESCVLCVCSRCDMPIRERFVNRFVSYGLFEMLCMQRSPDLNVFHERGFAFLQGSFLQKLLPVRTSSPYFACRIDERLVADVLGRSAHDVVMASFRIQQYGKHQVYT
ncbi:hypothetical protein NECAME_02649 [Necator americanus]|uniref:Uncharacterized protein n=1 Tax=Necator americanus TaxID=51031 RepID=W2TBK4_NECAM|nr:hypothetical protein NECAME_02649 [Necator americanus]ETN79223.1 hypothetical protein NECAME_02649 [Necator americanus]